MNHESHFRIKTVSNKYKKTPFQNLFNGRKFRVVASISVVYAIVGAGVGYLLLSPNPDLANASISVTDSSVIATISEESISGDEVSLKLSLNNTNKDVEIVDIIGDFYTSQDTITWSKISRVGSTGSDNLFGNNSFVNINPLNGGESLQYIIKGKIKNTKDKNITVMSHIKYSKNDNLFEVSTNKIFYSLD